MVYNTSVVLFVFFINYIIPQKEDYVSIFLEIMVFLFSAAFFYSASYVLTFSRICDIMTVQFNRRRFDEHSR